MQLPNGSSDQTRARFCSNQRAYWEYDAEDINDVEVPETQSLRESAILKARDYAQVLGAKQGRMITCKEANSLKKDYADMIFGTANKNAYGNYLIYWTSKSYFNTGSISPNGMWYVNGRYKGIKADYYSNGDHIGVRPVIVIAKNKVQGL